MQDRFAGDIGDFGKLALLRALMPGRRLAVCWYFVPNDGKPSNDGKHVGYLEQADRFEHLEPEVFKALKNVTRGVRSVEAIEHADLLPHAAFHRTPVPRRVAARAQWFEVMKREIELCDLVFIDPDNGVGAGAIGVQHVAVDEVRGLLRRGRSLLVYHHQTRRKGGAKNEYEHLAELFRNAGATRVEAVRLKPYSSRFHFLLDGDAVLSVRLRGFANKGGNEAVLFL